MAKPNQPGDAGSDAVKKGGKLKIILPLALVLIACSGGAFLGYSQYAKIAAVAGSDAEEVEEEAAPEPIEYGQFGQLDGLVVNPAGTGGRRFLMITLGLESENGKALLEIEEKDVVVRDVVLRLLSERTVEELSEIAYRDTLKDTLRTAINGVLDKGELSRLYFTKYVLQ